MNSIWAENAENVQNNLNLQNLGILSAKADSIAEKNILNMLK